MLWQEELKQAGVNIHVMATGAGAGLQQKLWEVCGSSAYLSGASFPYSQEEQAELLGFTPEHFCSMESAVDLASAAYMKAYRFGGKKPVGLGLTASVASDQEHRGDHRVFVCVITDTQVLTHQYTFLKGTGDALRMLNGECCDDIGFYLLSDAIGICPMVYIMSAQDATELATARFFAHPFFHANGTRDNGTLQGKDALMAGAFNPPHPGHIGMAQSYKQITGGDTIFEITVDPPHKAALSVQDMLKRAKGLQGHNRIFCKGDPMYLDKAERFPGHPILMGADAALRLFEPKWGIDPLHLFKEFVALKTKVYVAERVVDGKLVTCADIIKMAQKITGDWDPFEYLLGHWDVSSSEIRNKLSQDSK
jgi:nicotinamide mononucleotide (NMN) deamidase PncC